jgi:hypothetical protein
LVRGAAALLAAAAYFLAVGELPEVDGEAGRYAAGCAGALAVGLAALSPLGGRDDPVGLAVFGLGAALLATALAVVDVGAAANPVEALLAAAAGLLFAWSFALPAAVVAVPVVVAGIDVASVLGGPSDPLARVEPVDVLSFDLPRWGGDGSVAGLALLDATFLALFAAWSLRYALRPRLAIPLMVAGLPAAVALGVALDRTVPSLPFVAGAFLLAGIDRLPGLLRRHRGG